LGDVSETEDAALSALRRAGTEPARLGSRRFSA
jgi:hypothetical protein